MPGASHRGCSRHIRFWWRAAQTWYGWGSSVAVYVTLSTGFWAGLLRARRGRQAPCFGPITSSCSCSPWPTVKCAWRPAMSRLMSFGRPKTSARTASPSRTGSLRGRCLRTSKDLVVTTGLSSETIRPAPGWAAEPELSPHGAGPGTGRDPSCCGLFVLPCPPGSSGGSRPPASRNCLLRVASRLRSLRSARLS